MSTIQFAWLTDINTIDLVINGNSRPIDLLLLDLKGNTIPFTIKHEYNDDFFHLSISTPYSINLSENIYFLHRQKRFYLYPTKELLNKHYFVQQPLGAIVTPDKLSFGLWSPTASMVKVTLFHPVTQQYIYQYSLTKSQQGIWETNIQLKDFPLSTFHKLLYHYEITSMEVTNTVIDPYAKSLTPVTKKSPHPKSVVIDFEKFIKTATEAKKNSDLLSSPLEFIGYEAHIRDFTISPDAPIAQELKGTYAGFSKLAPYLQDLGITHVQLMPVQKFHSVDETRQEYQDQNCLKEDLNYNWGYDPLHYFTLEGWYSTTPEDPTNRIIEFHSMVKNLHLHNVGVIMDVVYNHIYDEKTLECVAPGCYLRRNSWGDISYGTGAGASVESRIFMVRKLVIDSLKYFTRMFNINGFRFDLMSFMDHDTMIEIRKELGSDVILYGEGWNFTDIPLAQAITKNNYPKDIGLGIFNDSCRDAFIGHLDHHGIVQGNLNENLKAKSAILGGIKNYPHDYNGDGRIDVILGNDSYNYFADDPVNTINFLDVHDGFTLWDKINLTVAGDSKQKERSVRRALSLLFSSQGRIVLHGGVEFGRSKPMSANDPTPYRAHSSQLLLSENQDQFFHENSYCSGDWTNMIRWENKNQFPKLFSRLKSLIKLRRELNVTRFNNAQEIKDNIKFIEKTPPIARNAATSFSQLPKLIINFTGGPALKKLYLIGEIFSTQNGNPENNPHLIEFDAQGNSTIEFSKKQIEQFNTTMWGFDNDLQIKLVKTAGEWNYLHSAYSPLGFNLISLYTLDENYEVTINLAVEDYHSILEFVQEPSLLAYTLSHNTEPIIIIHNLSSETRTIKIESKKTKNLKIKNIFNEKELASPFEIKHHRSWILKVDHPVEEIFLEIQENHQ